MTPPLDLDALERTAQAATPGPWVGFGYGPSDSWVRITREDWPDDPVCEVGCNQSRRVADAAHIAAFNPTTALALIAELRAARERERRVREVIDNAGFTSTTLKAVRRALEGT